MLDRPWTPRFADEMDRGEFDQTFAEYAPRVRSYLRRQGLSLPLAEEIVQEVMLTVWRESARFDETKGSMNTWVFTIARNRLIDSVRRKKRPEPDPEDPCWVGERNVRAPSPEVETALRELGGRVVLHFLPPYCPDANRIERLWGDLHDNVTRNHRCGNMEDLMDNVRSYLRDVSPFPGSKPEMKK